MKISVVIPVHNGGAAFSQCLRGLAQATPSPDEVIVVPDGESDGSWKYAEAYGTRVLTPTPAPRGPAHARNRGAEAATGDLLFFVDADVIIHADAIAEIQTAFAEDPDLDALIGSYDDAPGAPSFLSQYRNLLHHYVHQTGREEATTFWGACGVVRREVFTEMGGFNERYARPSIEDIELGYRLTQAGHKIKLRKTLLVTHLKHWDARSILKTDFFARALPWTELLLRDQTFTNDLNINYASRISVMAVFVLLMALVGAFWQPLLLIPAAVSAGLLLALNAPLYRFFYHRRGLRFALKTIPWHWLYYLYSGLAFATGVTRHALRSRTTDRSEPAPA